MGERPIQPPSQYEFHQRMLILSKKICKILRRESVDEIGIAAMISIMGSYAEHCTEFQREVLVDTLREMAKSIETGSLWQEKH